MKSFNKQKPYKSAGGDFSDTNPIFAYYFYKHYLDAAVNIYRDLLDAGEKQALGN